jgi:hypothetical protein
LIIFIINSLREVIDYIVRFAEELNKNPEVFDDIYSSVVSIGKSLFEILSTLFRIAGLSGEVGSDAEKIRITFIAVADILKTISFLFTQAAKNFNLLPVELNIVINFLNYVLEILNSITGKKWKIDISLGSGIIGFDKIVDLLNRLEKSTQKPKIKESTATFGQLTSGLVGSDSTYDAVENGKKVTKRRFNIAGLVGDNIGKDGPGLGQDPFTQNSKNDPFSKEANDLRLKSKGGKNNDNKDKKERAKALLASAILWVFSLFFTASPSFFAAIISSSANFSAIGRPFLEKAASISHLKARACFLSGLTSLGTW